MYTTVCALPLTLLNFIGIKNNNSVLLTWKTANEINTSHFTVQRSLNAVDFSDIRTVPATPGSVTKSYSFTDNVTAISCFQTKYHCKLVRPITYIQNVLGYSSWASLLSTPAHPEYSSAHCVISAAAAKALTAIFGALQTIRMTIWVMLREHLVLFVLLVKMLPLQEYMQAFIIFPHAIPAWYKEEK